MPLARHISITFAARRVYSSGERSFSLRMTAFGQDCASLSILVRKSSRHSFRLVTKITSDIEIIIEDRLESFFFNVLIHGAKTPSIVYLKLFVTLLALLLLSAVFAFVVAYAG